MGQLGRTDPALTRFDPPADLVDQRYATCRNGPCGDATPLFDSPQSAVKKKSATHYFFLADGVFGAAAMWSGMSAVVVVCAAGHPAHLCCRPVPASAVRYSERMRFARLLLT
jgi:hypothetical protein